MRLVPAAVCEVAPEGGGPWARSGGARAERIRVTGVEISERDAVAIRLAGDEGERRLVRKLESRGERVGGPDLRSGRAADRGA